jgi:hypothetical protein
MQIAFDALVQMVVKAVVAELNRQGVTVTGIPGPLPAQAGAKPAASVGIDFSEYKTPVLAERQVQGVGRGTAEIVVPPGTIVTEGARDLMHKRKITLTITRQS